MSEQIVTGKKYRILTDVAQKIWQRVSFWTKSSDVEFNDGKTAETKVGAINGITDSLVSTSSNIAASAKAVSELNGNLGNCTFSVQSDGAYVTYTPTGGADSVTKKLGESETTPILLQCAIGAEWSTHSHSYTCPSDGYYLVGAGGRVMTGCYVTKNSISQKVNQIGTGDFRSYNCIVKCVKGDIMASSVTGEGGMGTMVKIVFFVQI